MWVPRERARTLTGWKVVDFQDSWLFYWVGRFEWGLEVICRRGLVSRTVVVLYEDWEREIYPRFCAYSIQNKF